MDTKTNELRKNFKNYLSAAVAVPDDEWNFFETYFKILFLKKDQCFFNQGEHIEDIGFVLDGLLINFHTDQDGEDYVKKFSTPISPITCYASLLRGGPAKYSAKAFEPTTLLTIKHSKLTEMYDRHPCWEKVGRYIAEIFYLEKETRDENFLAADAKARYINFCHRHPELLKKIPQYLIASYIGITPVSLSRLKREKTVKNYDKAT